MRWIMMLLTLSSVAWCQPSKGAHDGISVQIKNARMSTNGKSVVIQASGVQSTGDFVLVCDRSESHCAFPRTGATYRVISMTENGLESWGLVSADRHDEMLVFDLMYAGIQ